MRGNDTFLQRLQKPEYFFQPKKLLQRLLPASPPAPDSRLIRLPWGMELQINPREDIGHAIHCLGIYDLPVSEALWRLLEPGDRALDLGANLGYMTALMAFRVGAAGRVLAFEPQPAVYACLAENLRRWEKNGLSGVVQAYELAISNIEGSVQLIVPPEFAANRGLAHLARMGEPDGIPTVTVAAARLDDLTGRDEFAVMKIDIEGHERQALEGATGLLAGRRVRHIIFEAQEQYPNPVSQLLESFGYAVFSLGINFWGPRLEPASVAASGPGRRWLAPSMIATLDLLGLRHALGPRGWRVLRGRAPGGKA